MKVLAFNGSPRKGGNTQILLLEAVKGAREQGAEVTVYDLNWMNIRPCQHCGGCADTGRCVIPDDMQTLHRDIRTADRIILASPIFFFGVSGQTKIMIDRCQPFWAEKYVRKQPVPPGAFGRKGLLLLVGGMKRNPRNKGFECSEVTARAFFRTVNVPEHTTLTYDGVDKKGAILEHPTALKESHEAGKALIASNLESQTGNPK
jgi:multimeric flavodoxin WrbA